MLAVAKKHAKSAAQVLVRWGVQKRLSVCVKSSNPERARANLDVANFELDEGDVASLDALTTPEAIETWRGHYEKRRAGTEAPT